MTDQAYLTEPYLTYDGQADIDPTKPYVYHTVKQPAADALQGPSPHGPYSVPDGSQIVGAHYADPSPRIRNLILGNGCRITGRVLIDGPIIARNDLTVLDSVCAQSPLRTGDRASIGAQSEFQCALNVGIKSTLHDNIRVGDYSSVGVGSVVGRDFKTGKNFYVSVANSAEVKRTVFKHNATFGEEAQFPQRVDHTYEFGNNTAIAPRGRIQGQAVFGSEAQIGENCAFTYLPRDRQTAVTFGENAVIHGGVYFLGPVAFKGLIPPLFLGPVFFFSSATTITYVPTPERLDVRGEEIDEQYTRKLLDVFVLANIDGSKRTLNLYLTKIRANGEHQVLVRAGCFYGTVSAFCTKAKFEGKKAYVDLVYAAAMALVKKHSARAPAHVPKTEIIDIRAAHDDNLGAHA